MPFYPIRRNDGMVAKDVFQDDNYGWNYSDKDGKIYNTLVREDFLLRGLKALKKNSMYKHKIIIDTEDNVTFNNNYLNKLKNEFNVEFYYNKHHDSYIDNQMQSYHDLIMSLPDDEIVCEAYSSDVICGKLWDLHIKHAYDKYGDSFVYVPMWVEPRGSSTSAHVPICGERNKHDEIKDETTCYNIWYKWRQEHCCHSLSMKFPVDKEYAIERELDEFSSICNQFNQEYIIERAGERNYCYYNSMVSRNIIFKKAAKYFFDTTQAPDLSFDNHLSVNKIAVTRSHLFHLHYPCILDEEEVLHVDE